MAWRSAAVVRRSKSDSCVWLVKGSMFKGSRLLGASDGAPTSVYPQPTSDPISPQDQKRTHTLAHTPEAVNHESSTQKESCKMLASLASDDRSPVQLCCLSM